MLIGVLLIFGSVAATQSPVDTSAATPVSLHDDCAARSHAMDFAAAIAICQRAADDDAASAWQRIAALAALAASLAVMNEPKLAEDAFVRMLVLDGNAALSTAAGPPIRAAFDEAAARLRREGAVHARLEQHEQRASGTVHITLVVTADPLHRVAGARVIDDRGSVPLHALDNGILVADVPIPPARLPYHVELFGPADTAVVTEDDPLGGAIGADPVAAPAPPPPVYVTGGAPARPRGHTIAASVAYEPSAWSYNFDGGGIGDASVSGVSTLGASLLVDALPLSFIGVRWLGVDGELGLAQIPFKISGGQVTIRPAAFDATQTRAAAAVKARTTFYGIVFGARAGYFFYGASVPVQTVIIDGEAQNLTVVPGYTFHAASLGAEAFFPLAFFDRPFEIDLRADWLPLTYYEEAPDNPGAVTSGFGWSGSVAARYAIWSGVFAEARAHILGADVTYARRGSRLTLAGDQPQQLQGGTVVNTSAGVSFGVGFLY